MRPGDNASDVKVAIMAQLSAFQKHWGALPLKSGHPWGLLVEFLKGQRWMIHPGSLPSQPPRGLAKVYPVLLAVMVSSGLLWGLCQLSANGDMTVLKQHLFGQVHLSSGTYSARSTDELNQLSWENGLEIMETLDTANLAMAHVEKLISIGHPPQYQLLKASKTLDQHMTQLNTLLKDRQTLENTVTILKGHELYAPVFQEYLSDTRNRYQALKSTQAPAAQTAQTLE